jgi:hypothetical protein
MPNKALLVAVAAIAGVAATSWLLATDNTGRFSGHTTKLAGEAAPATHQADVLAASQPQQAQPEPPSDNALGFMLASVADDYRQTIRYPEYSIPLTPAQAEAYQGNRYHPVALPLEGDGEFVVTLDKFRFKRGEPILVAASLTGRQVFGDTMSATLESIPDRDREDSAVLESVEPGYYEGTVSSDHDPGEYRLIVEARVDSSAVRHVSTLNIEPDLGNFEGLERPYVTGNDLVIPVKFDPKNSGHYSLSAQLYSGNTPLALLQQETALSSGSGTIELRAHGSVLAGRDLQGSLQLRNLQIRQLPARPGDPTHYAYGPNEGYEFSPPDLEKLRDEPAVNPESEQRAQLLQQLADRF